MATNETIEITNDTEVEIRRVTVSVSSLIRIIRGKQVILDSDLAMLYQVETGALNRAVKRNKKRFPEDFCFQLTEEEFLRCQNGISKGDGPERRGGRRYMPYAFTEQGISMLSAIIHSDVAINVSIGIMRAFVEMRRFIANNAMLFEKISDIELKQLEYQKSTDARFDKVFQYIDENAESEQKIFFDGQIYDAFSLLVSLIQKAKDNIVLIDGYVSVDTLNIISKKAEGIKVTVYTYPGTRLSSADITTFNAQYPALTVKHTNVFHDRFLIIDHDTVYHIGASLKDAGKKCFGISLIEDPGLVSDLHNRLKEL